METIWAIHRAAGHYRAADRRSRKFRRSAQRAKTVLRAMEESAASPEMVNYVGLLKLDDVALLLVAVNELERALSRVPAAFSGRQKPAKGPAPRAWYSGFVRDLAEIADGLGIERDDRGGDRADDPHATPFTRFVFAVEKLLPREARSKTLSACAKRIDRAIKASAHEIDIDEAFMARVQGWSAA